MQNWKTTTLGILTIMAGVINAATQYLSGKAISIPELMVAITGGWGLIHAKDAKPNGAAL